jgi:hypothetical protein
VQHEHHRPHAEGEHPQRARREEEPEVSGRRHRRILAPRGDVDLHPDLDLDLDLEPDLDLDLEPDLDLDLDLDRDRDPDLDPDPDPDLDPDLDPTPTSTGRRRSNAPPWPGFVPTRDPSGRTKGLNRRSTAIRIGGCTSSIPSPSAP